MMVMLILYHHILDVFNNLFICTSPHSEEFALNLRGDFGLFSSAETVKTLATLRDALNALCIKRCA